MKTKIFIACDTTNLKKLNNIIKNTQTNNLKIGYKFGLEFFYSPRGRIFISNIKKRDFLDLKLNDIPNTCAAAINAIKDLKNINYITVHISGGQKCLKL